MVAKFHVNNLNFIFVIIIFQKSADRCGSLKRFCILSGRFCGHLKGSSFTCVRAARSVDTQPVHHQAPCTFTL